MSYEYRIGLPYNLIGLLAIASGSATVTGTDTDFVTEVAAGDYLLVAGVTTVVVSIEDANNLTVDSNFEVDSANLAAVRLRLLNVEDLGLPAPHGLFTPYTLPVTLGDGSVRGAGWKTADWKWGFVKRAQREALRAFCPGASAAVFIKTRTNENDAFAIFTAKMIWPVPEDPQAGRRLDFNVKFQGLTPWP